MAKTRLRTRILLTLLALLVVPFLILIAELAARLFTDPIDPLSVFITSPQLQQDTQGATTSGLFEFDPLLTWRLRPNLKDLWWDFTPVTTNASHLRMARPVGAKNGLRILCLGDSVTFGYRVPTAHDPRQPRSFHPSEQSYPALLEESLRQQFPGRNIEVLPLACPGYTSGQGLAWLRRDIAALQPDIVTACFGWNDVRAAGVPDRLTFPSGSGQVTVRRLMAHSQLLLYLAKSAQKKRATDLLPPNPEPRTSPVEYLEHFAQMNALCRQHNAWFGIILPVYRDHNRPGDYPEGDDHPGDAEEAERMTAYRDQLATHARQNNIPHLLIPELTEAGYPDNAELFGERIHPNAPGHAILAKRLGALLDPIVKGRLPK